MFSKEIYNNLKIPFAHICCSAAAQHFNKERKKNLIRNELDISNEAECVDWVCDERR